MPVTVPIARLSAALSEHPRPGYFTSLADAGQGDEAFHLLRR